MTHIDFKQNITNSFSTTNESLESSTNLKREMIFVEPFYYNFWTIFSLLLILSFYLLFSFFFSLLFFINKMREKWVVQLSLLILNKMSERLYKHQILHIKTRVMRFLASFFIIVYIVTFLMVSLTAIRHIYHVWWANRQMFQASVTN